MTSTYHGRLVTADRAIEAVRAGDHVWIALGHSDPNLTGALLGADIPVHVSMELGDDLSWLVPEIADQVKVDVLFATPGSREAVNDFRADYTPWWVWGAHKARDERGQGPPVDVSFLVCSPPNEAGWCCVGSVLWDSLTVARAAPTVIAAVNESVSHTFGDTWIHESQIDWFVESDADTYAERHAQISEALPPRATEVEIEIALHVSGLVRDGDTVQVGTGQTTRSVVALGALDQKNDLGYFAELTVPGLIRLAERGVINGSRLQTHPGKFVTTMATGEADENTFVHENPMFEFHPVEYMHHPGVIGRNDNLVAINNALVVDLTGQVGAGHIGPRIWSGTGGQLSYALGAMLSKGGRSVTVLPSTAQGGTASRIVPTFEAGQVVTIPRDIADTVVTEFGVAELLNRSQRDRAAALIDIAHPSFRDELRAEARWLFGL